MPPFTTLFLAVLGTSTLLQTWLTRRHIANVLAHRAEVPAAFRDAIPLEAHQKAADYTVTGVRFGLFELLVNALFLLAWTVGGGVELFDHFWRGMGLGPLLTGVAVIVSAVFVMGLLELPLAAWHTFAIEQRFGFNHSTPRLFLIDTIKQTLLSLALGVPLAAVALWLMNSAGTFWWLYLWVVWISFSLIMMWAYPAFIAPLFNKFTALEDAALATRIQGLLSKCGFKSQGIFVMDGSRRSGHGNAYFTGLGDNKRIVFFDTLIATLEGAEIEAVLAHELGHFRLKHVIKRMVVMALMSLAGLALLGWLVGQPWFYAGLGVRTPSHHAALLLFMLAAPVFSFLLTPLIAMASRKHEFEADAYAAQQTDAKELIHALVKLYRDNANTLTPDPLYSAFHDSHPPAPVRIGRLSAKLA